MLVAADFVLVEPPDCLLTAILLLDVERLDCLKVGAFSSPPPTLLKPLEAREANCILSDVDDDDNNLLGAGADGCRGLTLGLLRLMARGFLPSINADRCFWDLVRGIA